MVEYQSTLDLCGSLLVIVLIGFLYGISNHYKRGHVVIINNIVFIIALPCHIFTALRKQDWFDSKKEWEFIAAFLVLRILMLILAIIITLIRRQSIFECVSIFLGTSWISTIILGLPLCSSIFGPTYIFYGIYAALSSFFFQLPFMIAMFEIQKTVNNFQSNDKSSDHNNHSDRNLKSSDNEEFHSSFIQDDALSNIHPHKSPHPLELQPTGDITNDNKSNNHSDSQRFTAINQTDDDGNAINMDITSVVASGPDPSSNKHDRYVKSNKKNLCCRITKLVLLAWFKNPIAWAIFWGFFFAFIWSGLDMDQSAEDSDWPNFLDMAMNSDSGLAALTSPLGVCVIGLFAADRFLGFWQSKNRSFKGLFIRSLKNEIPELFLYLFLKFFVCPALMCFIVWIFGFDGMYSNLFSNLSLFLVV